MASKETFTIRTPSSSANIGPGFDVIGLALSIYLELTVTIDRSVGTSSHPLNCRLTYEGEGENSGDITLDPSSNLITRVALYVLRCHNQRAFPAETHVHIKNPIPLGRGLGSSGAAVVAGVMLGKEVGGLHHLDMDRLFDFCLMIGTCLILLPALPPGLIFTLLAEQRMGRTADLFDSCRTTPRQRGRGTLRRLRRHVS